jgi:hypothetical protein
MDRHELLDCIREASEALAEFRHLLPQHSAAAHAQVEMARQHLDYAITLLRHAPTRSHLDVRAPRFRTPDRL